MRLWHLIFAVALASVIMALARDPLSRVFLIVFATGLGEVALGLAAVLALFQTVGAIGEAHGLRSHAVAIVATSVVLAVGSVVMSVWLCVGAWFVSVTV